MRNQKRISSDSLGWIDTIRSFSASSWATFLVVCIIVFIAILGFIGFTIYFAYGFSETPPQHVSAPASTSESIIDWHENKFVSIYAEDLEGALTALGVAHASAYPWQMYLWRQTATGSLTEWFGSNLINIDRFSKRLRLASLARESFDELPEEQVRLLKAYTAGVNAVLQDAKHIKQDEITLLDVAPELWEPWHSLAIERLFAWLAIDLYSLAQDSTGNLAPEWESVIDNDKALQEWLQLHGFQYSIAGTWPSDTLSRSTVFHRFVHGSSAIPLFQEASIRIGNHSANHVATLPGTLIFPSGQSEDSSWFILPSSNAEITIRTDSLPPKTTHDRFRSRDGNEELLVLENYDGWLLPENQAVLSDSIPGLSWKGFTPGTDLPSYTGFLSGQNQPFNLIDGHGLVTKNDSWTILGSPPFVHQLSSGVLIGITPWSGYQASRLNVLLSDPHQASPSNWPEDCHNNWAEEQASFLLEQYLLRRISFDEEYSDALTYLRNWDYSYTPSSIGAIIFDSWLQELPDSLYNKVIHKELSPSDTLARTYLQESIASLKDKFGNDLSKWRLDITKPISRHYPAWNADSLFSPSISRLSNTLFAPLSFPGRGHASTLCWGSFQSEEKLEVSARWEAWTTIINDESAYHWRKHATSNSFLGRFLISNSPSSTYSFDITQDAITTTFVNQE